MKCFEKWSEPKAKSKLLTVVQFGASSLCTASSTASPPDVRRGYAPPVSSRNTWAAPLVRALPLDRQTRGCNPRSEETAFDPLVIM
jgi:hypothetical protein